MQVGMGVGWNRAVEGAWQGIAERSLTELLSIAERLAALPAFDLDRDGMIGATAWLTVLSGEGVLHLYFSGGGMASFEWYPDGRGDVGGFCGDCAVEVGRKALRRMETGSSPLEILREGASEIMSAPDG